MSARAATALTIAGSDPSGGAGLELDLQVFARHGVPGAAIATCLTDQDSRRMYGLVAVAGRQLTRRLDRVLQDLVVPAAKIGLVPGAALMRRLAESALFAGRRFVVVDPVLGPSRGAAVHQAAGVKAMWRWLLTRADLVTPNAVEAGRLLGWSTARVGRDPEAAIRALLDRGMRSVLLKGGHLPGSGKVIDRLRGELGEEDMAGKRLPLRPRGTGCALTAALVAGWVQGLAPVPAVRRAVEWVRSGISQAAARGRGRPFLHWQSEQDGRGLSPANPDVTVLRPPRV